MYYLVAYLSNPTTSALRVLKRVFGKEFGESVLPVVSSPFGSIGDAQVRLHELLEYVSFGSDQAILVQPEENKIEYMPKHLALETLRASDAWHEFSNEVMGEDSIVSIQSREYARCWVFLASVGHAQIPPGEGFVVDKHSKRVFPRRYADVIMSDTSNPIV